MCLQLKKLYSLFEILLSQFLNRLPLNFSAPLLCLLQNSLLLLAIFCIYNFTYFHIIKQIQPVTLIKIQNIPKAWFGDVCT